MNISKSFQNIQKSLADLNASHQLQNTTDTQMPAHDHFIDSDITQPPSPELEIISVTQNPNDKSGNPNDKVKVNI